MNWWQRRSNDGGLPAEFTGRRSVAELNGYAYRPPPIPPDYRAPPAPTAPVHVIEPTSGWWRENGKFGQRFQGRPPALEGTIIPLAEQLELPGPPAPWWFNFFRYDRRLTDEIVTLGNWELRARLIYGVGGAQNIIEVDLLQGVQLALVCNSVTPQLITYRPGRTTVGGAPYSVAADAEVVAGVMFGKGGAGGGAMPPTWTTPFIELDPGGGDMLERFPVPDFARSVVIHTDQTVQAGLDQVVLGFRGPNGPIKEVVLGDCYDICTQEKGISIPGSCNQVELSAAAATNTGNVFGLQFFLAL